MGRARVWHTSSSNAVGGWKADGGTRVSTQEGSWELQTGDSRPACFTLHWVKVEPWEEAPPEGAAERSPGSTLGASFPGPEAGASAG